MLFFVCSNKKCTYVFLNKVCSVWAHCSEENVAVHFQWAMHPIREA